MNFEIDVSSLKQITITKSRSIYANQTYLTHDQLIKIIKGEDIFTSMHAEDNPEFTELRELLGAQGFIRIERLWWNGDEVQKEFTLNGHLFRQGDQFPSASPMKYILANKGR